MSNVSTSETSIAKKTSGSKTSVQSSMDKFVTVVPNVGLTPGTPAGGEKRKAEESPEASRGEEKEGRKRMILEDKKAMEYAGEVETLFNEVEAMREIIRVNINTKSDLKMAIEKAFTSVQVLKMLSKGVSICGTGMCKKVEVETTLQDKRESALCENCKKELGDIKEEIGEMAKKIVDPNEIEKEEKNIAYLINRRWPENAFQKVVKIEGDPFKVRQGNIIIFMDKNEKNSPLIGMLKSKYADSEEVIESGIPHGKFEILETVTKVGGEPRKKDVYIVNGLGQELTVLDQIRKKAQELNPKAEVFNIAATRAYNWENLRKSAELIFRENEEKVEFFVPKGTKHTEKSRDKPDVLCIKSGNVPYAEMVRSLKEVVDPDKLGVRVNSVKKTKNDEIIITTEKGKGNILKKEINSKLVNTDVDIRGTKVLLQVSNIESDMDKTEIANSIKQNEGCSQISEDDLITVFETKGGQTAVLSVQAENARKILENRVLKIGWLRCNVRIRISTTKCFNCLKVGHKADRCSEKKVEGTRCFKCTKIGHKAKDCTELSFCIACKQDGHRNDSTACPLYRKYIKKREKKAKNTQRVENTENEEEEEVHMEE